MSVEARFWAKVNKDGPVQPGMETPCWEWTAAKVSSKPGRDYGSFGVGGRTVLAHRYAYAITNGPVPDGKQVIHACDWPPCVNPAHLSADDQQRNMRDAAVRRRLKSKHFQRESNPQGRFTASQIMDIRRRYADGETQSALASEYGTDQAYIHHVVTGHVWSYPETPLVPRRTYREVVAREREVLLAVEEALKCLRANDAIAALAVLEGVKEEPSSGVKLDADKVEEIRRDYLERRMTLRAITGKHGITLSAVWDALYRG